MISDNIFLYSDWKRLSTALNTQQARSTTLHNSHVGIWSIISILWMRKTQLKDIKYFGQVVGGF
jgi:hypothetical protein